MPKISKDGKCVEVDGEMWKIKYNETSAMLKKREVKSGGIAEIARMDFCGTPKELEKLTTEGWLIVGKAHNWKHIVQEKHNLGNGINKRRREMNLQADGINGEGKTYADDENETEMEPTAMDRVGVGIVGTIKKLPTWIKILGASAIVVAASGAIIYFKVTGGK